MDRHLPTFSTSRSLSARSRVWRSCAPPVSGRPDRRRRRRRAGTSELIGEIESLVSDISALGSGCGASSCSRFTAPAARPRRCRRPGRRGALSSRSSVSRPSRETAGAWRRAILRHEDDLAPALFLACTRSRRGPHRSSSDAIVAGRLVPVLGSGINLLPGGRRMPRGSRHLDCARRWGMSPPISPSGFECPREHARELARLSQYVAVTSGRGTAPRRAPRPLRRGTSSRVRYMRSAGAAARSYLRETGGAAAAHRHDELRPALERAFAEADEEFDVVSYVAVGPHRGKFLPPPARRRRESSTCRTGTPSSRSGAGRSILKLHGQVDRRRSATWESFVVTEDDYIDYLAQATRKRVPVDAGGHAPGAATSSSSATGCATGTCA